MMCFAASIVLWLWNWIWYYSACDQLHPIAALPRVKHVKRHGVWPG